MQWSTRLGEFSWVWFSPSLKRTAAFEGRRPLRSPGLAILSDFFLDLLPDLQGTVDKAAQEPIVNLLLTHGPE